MKNNIQKLYLTNFLTGFVFWYAIEKLFLRSIGVSAVGIAVNAIAYVVVSTVFDIPTGILADRWNRKYTLMLGIGCLAISSLIMGLSHGLALYIIATAIWGLYTVFTQGTYQAMTYDSLHELGRQNEYVKQQGRSYGMFLVGVSLSSIFGGYLGQHLGYRSTYFLTLVPCLLNLLVLWSLREPVFHKDTADTKLWAHVKQTVHLLAGQQFLLIISVLFIGISILNYAQNEYGGLYYIALGFGSIGSGWANAGKWIASALGRFMSERLSKYVLWCIPIFFAVFLGFSVWRSTFGLILFTIAGFLQSIIMTNLEGVVQENVPSSIRATALSTLSFAYSIIVIPISLIFGVLARHDVFHSYQFTAVIGLLFGLAWFLRPKSVRQSGLLIRSTRAEVS
jgi:MFS family permease